MTGIYGVNGNMVYLIGGSSHVGKTLIAQKLMERTGYPYTSLDHLKMGFIRSGMTDLTVEDDLEMRYWMWPFVTGMIRTAIENEQNLILEGCYIPAEWRDSFSEEELSHIRSIFIVMSERYIREHFSDIVEYANVIEKRLDDQPDMERLTECSKGFQKDCEEHDIPCYIIDDEFCPEEILSALLNDENESDNDCIGRITEIRKNSYKIRFKDEEIPAKLKGNFYEGDAESLPVVGDYVKFIYNSQGDSLIQSVCERKSLLQRPDQAKTGVMQYMVANVDYCFIVTSLNEDYNYNRLVRYASIALQGGAIPVVILTKSDLCSNVGRFVREAEQISDKVRVHAISALLDIGLDELEEYMTPGTTICLMGSSGVGKSTLINAICGEEVMKASEIREADGKGRHTTTFRKLLELKNGVSIIDTPGMREVGMANVQDGIDDTFSDIVELESMCRFSNCRHETEPGCAIKAAIKSGELSLERYELYKSLGAENSNNYAKKKEISKLAKAYKKNKRF